MVSITSTGAGGCIPDNYDFLLLGWIPKGQQFSFTIVNNQIKQYEKVGSTWTVSFGDADKNRAQINHQWEGASVTDLASLALQLSN